MSKRDRRDRKRANRELAFVDGIRRELLEVYVRTRYVCDRCGLEQLGRHAEAVIDPDHPGGEHRLPWFASEQPVALCDGPLGLACSSETCLGLDVFARAA